MTVTALSEEEQAAVRRSVEQVRARAAAHLGANPGAAAAIGFIENLHRGVDAVVQRAAAHGVPTDCKAGCSFCCKVRVEASDAEIFYIARELTKRPAAELAAIVERLRRHTAESAAAPPPAARRDCAFLDNNLCSIYAIRPAVCRKAHSLAVAQCATFAAEIPQRLDIVLGAEALMTGTAAAYLQAGLPASGRELGGAVLAALTDASAAARWYGDRALVTDVPARKETDDR